MDAKHDNLDHIIHNPLLKLAVDFETDIKLMEELGLYCNNKDELLTLLHKPDPYIIHNAIITLCKKDNKIQTLLFKNSLFTVKNTHIHDVCGYSLRYRVSDEPIRMVTFGESLRC